MKIEIRFVKIEQSIGWIEQGFGTTKQSIVLIELRFGAIEINNGTTKQNNVEIGTIKV